MFYFTLTHQQIAYQIAALVNCCNDLSKKRSVSDILSGGTNYVAETHGQWVLGAVGLDRQSYTFTEIKHLVVHPDWRGKGVARHLLTRALGVISTKMAYATVREDNETSLKLFENLGFIKSGDYPAEDHRVILLVRVSPQWEKTKSGSKSHWLAENPMTSSELTSLKLGSMAETND
jgi:N-acetylglutamate synthase-like GNAT family acetyltransferase